MKECKSRGILNNIYLVKASANNGVCVIMDEKMKIKVVDVKRKRYGIITIILLFEENLLNITSSYAPQARFEDSDKKLKRVLAIYG